MGQPLFFSTWKRFCWICWMAQNFESRPLSFSAPRTPGSDCSTSKAVNMCHIFSWLVRCGPRTTLHSRPFKKNKVVNQHAINPIVNGCLYSIFIHLYPTHLWLLLWLLHAGHIGDCSPLGAWWTSLGGGWPREQRIEGRPSPLPAGTSRFHGALLRWGKIAGEWMVLPPNIRRKNRFWHVLTKSHVSPDFIGPTNRLRKRTRKKKAAQFIQRKRICFQTKTIFSQVPNSLVHWTSVSPRARPTLCRGKRKSSWKGSAGWVIRHRWSSIDLATQRFCKLVSPAWFSQTVDVSSKSYNKPSIKHGNGKSWNYRWFCQSHANL